MNVEEQKKLVRRFKEIEDKHYYENEQIVIDLFDEDVSEIEEHIGKPDFDTYIWSLSYRINCLIEVFNPKYTTSIDSLDLLAKAIKDYKNVVELV